MFAVSSFVLLFFLTIELGEKLYAETLAKIIHTEGNYPMNCVQHGVSTNAHNNLVKTLKEMGIKLGECNSQKKCLEDTQNIESRFEKLEKQLQDSQSKDEIIKDLKAQIKELKTNCKGPNKNVQVVMVTGGQGVTDSVKTSVELLSSNGTRLCSLPNLPEKKWQHSQTGVLACGGGGRSTSTAKSCFKFADSRWKKSHTMGTSRYGHTGWASPQGVLLIGGTDTQSQTSAELLTDNGGATPSFTLKNNRGYSCAIEDGEAVVLTGGHDPASKKKVMKYTKTGQAISLPYLKTGRHAHTCGKITKTDGATFYIVAGGWGTGPLALASTEILKKGGGHSWQTVASLPSRGYYLRGVSLANGHFMVSGGFDGRNTNADVLDYNPDEDKWTKVGQLAKARHYHGMSLVPEEIADYCA